MEVTARSAGVSVVRYQLIGEWTTDYGQWDYETGTTVAVAKNGAISKDESRFVFWAARVA